MRIDRNATDKPECKKCAKALQELENIDDEADQLDIGFVKIHDESLADEYNLGTLPALVYYRHQIPILYEGCIWQSFINLSFIQLLFHIISSPRICHDKMGHAHTYWSCVSSLFPPRSPKSVRFVVAKLCRAFAFVASVCIAAHRRTVPWGGCARMVDREQVDGRRRGGDRRRHVEDFEHARRQRRQLGGAVL